MSRLLEPDHAGAGNHFKMKHIAWKKLDLKELAALICDQLNKSGIEAVLVGGTCISIYTHNKYMSYDLDFVAYEPIKKIKESLSKLGFIYDKCKYFKRSDSDFFVEFLNPPIAVGNEPVTKFNKIKTPFGVLKLLNPTDCIKDRLSAYLHWDDKQSFEQALKYFFVFKQFFFACFDFQDSAGQPLLM